VARVRDPIPPPSPRLRVLPDEAPPRLGKRGKGIGREGAPPTGGLATEGLLSNPLYLISGLSYALYRLRGKG